MTGTERHVLLDCAYLLWRRGLRIMVITGLTVAAALGYNAFHGAAYTAQARILVTPAAVNLSVSGGGQAPGIADTATLIVQDHGQTARNQAELLADPGLIRALLPATALPPPVQGAATASLGRLARAAGERLGLLTPTTDAERTAARLAQALTVIAVGDTDVVKLTFTWPDRYVAASALNRILAGYQASVSGANAARAQAAGGQTRLEDARAALSAIDARITAIAPDATADAVRRRRAAADERLAAARAGADAARLERELLRRRQDAAVTAYKNGGWVDGHDTGGTIAPAFAALLKKRQDLLLADGKPGNPKIRAVDAQISRGREQAYRTVSRDTAAQLARLDAGIDTIQAAITADEAIRSACDTALSALDVLAQDRAAKLRRVEAERQALDAARHRIDDVWQEVGSTRALSAAAPPAQPDFPAPPLLLKAAVMLGLGAGLASAIAAERSRRTIDRPGDITRRLGLEVLARLEEYPAAGRR